MNFGKAMQVMYHPVFSALRGMIARMDYHGKPELVAQQMGLSKNPGSFDQIRTLLRMHELVSLYHMNNGLMPEDVSNATPLAALNQNATVDDRAADLARVILAGHLSDTEKHFLFYKHLIKPTPVEMGGKVEGFQWEHPRAPEELADAVDWEIFSGLSTGNLHLTEEECWVDAYVAKACWMSF